MFKIKRFKLIFFLTIVMLLLLSMTSFAQLVFRMPHSHSGDTPTTLGLYYFADRIEELTDGEIKIEVFIGGVLGSEVETMEQLLEGTIEMNRVSATRLGEFNPIMDIFSVPYLFRNEKHCLNVIHGDVGRELAVTCENYGVKLLTYFYTGSRSIYNTVRPINTPDDLEGLKIRVMGSKLMLDTMRILGASPTTTAYAEVYTALQTGVIDGGENPPASVVDMSFYEVADYYSLNEHFAIPDVIVISKEVWDELTPIHKAIFLRVSRETEKYVQELVTTVLKEALEIIAESGTKVNTITDENKALFIEKVAPIHEELKEKGTFAGYIDRIQFVTD
jgi:tripartite ATP-independent transporter DctP family solute receptor